MTKKEAPTMESVLRDLVRVAEQYGWRMSVSVRDGKRELFRVTMPPAQRK